jgi:hypothetical protein
MTRKRRMPPDRPDTDRRLADLEELRYLKALYCRLLDECCRTGHEGAVRLAEAIFTEDATIDIGGGVMLQGRAAFIDHVAAVVAGQAGWMWHSVTNPQITFDGDDRAEGSWMLLSLATPKDDPQAVPNETYRSYEDEYVRTPEGWRQQALRLRNDTRKQDPQRVQIRGGAL